MSAGRLFWVQRDGAVVEVPLTKARISVGRNKDCDLRIVTPSISARHAEFVITDSTTTIEDLRSTNGVKVNGRKIESIQLKHGDQIEMGNERLVYFGDSSQIPAKLAREGSEAKKGPNTRAPGGVAGPPTPSLAEIANRASSSKRRTPLRASIVVLSGNMEGRKFPLTKAVTTLGREGLQVFQIALIDGGYWAQRGPSSTAPYVNGAPVDDRGCRLAHLDVVELGGASVRFEIDPV